jgi:hypothetical protein
MLKKACICHLTFCITPERLPLGITDVGQEGKANKKIKKSYGMPWISKISLLKYTLSPRSKHPISVTLIQAKELNPLKGKSPIVWRIMTNRDIFNASQTIEIIDWYRCRWDKVLKVSGKDFSEFKIVFMGYKFV